MDVENITNFVRSLIFGPCFVKMQSTTDMHALVEQSQEGVEMCKLLILNCRKLMVCD